jgi:phosphotriesterase-related protein
MAVTTVQGRISADRLGVTTPHDHILIDLSNQYRDWPEISKSALAKEKVGLANIGILRRNPHALVDNLIIDDVRVAEEELIEFKRAGGDTIVDLSNIGLGRDPIALKRISRATGVNVICGCAYYYHDTHPKDMGTKTVADIKAEIVTDLTVGISGTGIKAGVIGEIGISPDVIHPDEAKVLKAAAEAQVETGVGIQVHIFPWTKNGAMPLGLEALDVLAAAGADLRKVSIGHADVAMGINVDYCKEIARRGAYVEFDNFGHEFYINKPDRTFVPGPFATDVERICALKDLVDSGYVRKVLLATDICHKCLLHKYGGWGYDHILTNIVPMMLENGITEDQINVLMKENPQAFLDDGMPC